ncbi:MAG: prolyl oligopeptidase family serine peptidase [Gammaproteobacteria bacterium]
MKTYYTRIVRGIASLALIAGLTGAAALKYPDTRRVEIVDVYHGTKVADPYRWLEAIESPETRRWVETQNALAQPWLESIPHRQWLKQRLTQLWNYERYGNPKKTVPLKAGGPYFYLRNDGAQNQSVLYVAETLTGEGRALVDPNAMRSDATDAIDDFEPSPRGDLVAYGVSDGGSDWQIWKFRRVRDGVDLPDTIVHTKFWGLSWARDGSGVYYSRYPARADGRGDDAGQPAIHFHRLGDPQAKDRLVYKVTDHPTRVPRGKVTDDGRYLIITLYDGAFRNGVNVLDLRRPDAAAATLFGAWDAFYDFMGSRGDELYFQTTNDAPLGRVVAVDVHRPQPANWRAVVPQSDVALDDAQYIGSRIIARYVKDAHSLVRVFARDGKPVGEVPLPGLGQAGGFDGDGTDPETFFSYTDFLTPTGVYRYDVGSNAASIWRKPKVPAATDPYLTEQVFYRSKDGTRVPMYITRRGDAKHHGEQPMLLYGYGGFNVSQLPAFSPTVLAWLEMGGTYAVANLRGGGEYGEAWHEAGVRSHKQNVFDDFIAAAEYLIAERYTRSERLAIYGRSNGGLLVAAALAQRPELFGAALPAVGVLDMLRYHTASANARQWSTDYGLSENAEDFRAQYAYSPYHNLDEGKCYPPTLVTTADRDDRVVPWHSYKFGAALQRAQGCANPVLVRVETRAGHGAGKPTWMRIEDFADQWAFIAKALGVAAPAAR